MRIFKLAVLWAGMLFILGGCPSYLSMQSTRTVEPGQVEVSGAAGTFAAAGASGVLSGLGGIRRPWQLEGAARFGIVPNLDLGVRLNLAFLGVSGGLKLRFLNTEKFQMAVAGDIGTSLWAPIFNALANASSQTSDIDAFLYWFNVNLLGSVPVGEGYLVFFGGKFRFSNLSLSNIDSVFGGTGGSGSVSTTIEQIQPGLMVGADIPINAGTRVLPEIDAHYDIGSRSFIFQFGVTVALGGHKKKAGRSSPTPAAAPPAGEPAIPPAPAPADEEFVPPPEAAEESFVPPPSAASR